ncbi:MAG: tryptophan--tRNA ligase, partial [Phenylobacterium sp.]|nr:tryptophan--tRNA ligase [Phenylobacterium sp.]
MTDQVPPAYSGPQRVLSGVQPSGALHLGNYLGALVKFARLQHEMDTFIFVADLHAITVWQDPARLADQVREITAAYLAAGLDPEKATIFPQSAVPAHAELAWIFNCV